MVELEPLSSLIDLTAITRLVMTAIPSKTRNTFTVVAISYSLLHFSQSIIA
jgi:hypothetical protein